MSLAGVAVINYILGEKIAILLSWWLCRVMSSDPSAYLRFTGRRDRKGKSDVTSEYNVEKMRDVFRSLRILVDCAAVFFSGYKQFYSTRIEQHERHSLFRINGDQWYIHRMKCYDNSFCYQKKIFL